MIIYVYYDIFSTILANINQILTVTDITLHLIPYKVKIKYDEINASNEKINGQQQQRKALTSQTRKQQKQLTIRMNTKHLILHKCQQIIVAKLYEISATCIHNERQQY